MTDVPQASPDPGVEQRLADAAEHRRAVADQLASTLAGWVEVAREDTAAARRAVTLEAMRSGAQFISGARLPDDAEHNRRGGIDLLVRSGSGYVPVLVVRHRITDPGRGARTSRLDNPVPEDAAADPVRKARAHSRDQLRLAHARRLLEAAGFAAEGRASGGVIGLDVDVVLWHDLESPTWPSGRTALTEYDVRFADRVAVASAARDGDEPLAFPSRVLECRSCPWWPVCERTLREARDVSLVVRGEDATVLREAGAATVDDLAGLDPESPDAPATPGVSMRDAVLLARAWQRDLALVRRVRDVRVPRADVELDVDMECYADSGAYMWGCLLSGADLTGPTDPTGGPAGTDLAAGYRAFATWDPLPSDDEARSFAEFWSWLSDVREATRRRGLSFRAYCYNELAENRWMLSSARRFAGKPGVPEVGEVRSFIDSAEWVDLFAAVQENFLCPNGKGLKVIAPSAGFHWRDDEAGGENSMRWYRDAVGMDGAEPSAAQRARLLRYNEDDVRATHAIRRWMTSHDVDAVPFADDL